MARVSGSQYGFASTGLVSLAMLALREIDADLLPAGVSTPDPMKGATLDASVKRDLLNRVYESHGPGPLLLVGQHLDMALEYPSLQVLMRSRSPQVLAEKWERLERYYHATNRTKIICEEHAFICSRHATTGRPSLAENLLIAGLTFGLSQFAGAKNAVLSIGHHHAEAGDLAGFKLAPDEDVSRFRISWADWPGGPGANPEATAQDQSATLRQRLKALLREDISQSWRVSDAARVLVRSNRSLQRELAADETSFSSVLRNVRVETANKLLSGSQTSLAEIGYCCGYADQAHFQRDYRCVMNMTPTDFRRLVPA